MKIVKFIVTLIGVILGGSLVYAAIHVDPQAYHEERLAEKKARAEAAAKIKPAVQTPTTPKAVIEVAPEPPPSAEPEMIAQEEIKPEPQENAEAVSAPAEINAVMDETAPDTVVNAEIPLETSEDFRP
jgi:hypothetical protein